MEERPRSLSLLLDAAVAARIATERDQAVVTA
jgi:hypothetical protein